MDSLITSITGIYAAKTELEKYKTEKEQKAAMEKIHSRIFSTACYNTIYFFIAVVSAGLIRWALL